LFANFCAKGLIGRDEFLLIPVLYSEGTFRLSRRRGYAAAPLADEQECPHIVLVLVVVLVLE
jgi:hypothetical protein